MRINCLGFARVIDRDGKYCLLLNRGRLKYNGQRLLSPIGGSLRHKSAGKAALERLGAFGFAQSGDLIFRIPAHKVPAVYRWYRTRAGRETSVIREAREELIDETRALTDNDFWDAEAQVIRHGRFDAETLREDAPERQTAYLIELSVMRFDGGAMDGLHRAARLPVADRQVFFVSKDEIMAGVTHDGVQIGPITRKIL